MKNAALIHSLLLTLSVLNAAAAVRTWDGSANGNISTAANWVGGIAPVNGDDLVFPTGVTRLNVTNNFIGGPRFRSITFEGSGFTLYGAFMVLSNGIAGENLSGVNRVVLAITLGASQTFSMFGDTSARLEIDGNIAMGVYSLNIGADSGTLFVGGDITGTGGITKSFAGIARLDGAGTNTYSGTTTILAGTLELNKGPLAGATAIPGDLVIGTVGAPNTDVVRCLRDNQLAASSDVTIGQAGWLDLQGENASIRTLTMNGGRVTGVGAGTLTLGGDVTATSVSGSLASISGNLAIGLGPRTFTVTDNPATDPDLDVSARISGSGGIIKNGAGTLAFSGSLSNNFIGATRVFEGTLLLRRTLADCSIPGNLFIGDGVGGPSNDVVRIENAEQISTMSVVIIASSGLLDQKSIGEAIGSLSGEGRVIVGPGTLSVGFNGVSSTFSGLITEPGGVLNIGALTKVGTGTLTLTANNTYRGATRVTDGTLLVNGGQQLSSVLVTGGTLGGTGGVGDVTLNGGSLAPGTSPGTFNCFSLTCSVPASLFFELGDGIPGTGSDLVFASGNVALNGATLHLSVDYPPYEGQRFTLINNLGISPVSGTFAGLPNGSILTENGVQFLLLYTDGGNNVTLVVTNTPLRNRGFLQLSGDGNLNGRLDPNECSLVNIVVTNTTGGPVTGIRATLVARSPGWSVTQPFATYPDLGPGQLGTNQTPFQLSLLPGYICGTLFVWELFLETDNYGLFRFFLSNTTGLLGPAVSFDNNTPGIIPDAGSADSIINVSNFNSAIREVSISLHITHPAVEDLDLSLISPGGSIINLSSDNGGAGTNYGTGCANNQRTVFTSGSPASPLITGASAPFVGTFRPEGSLEGLRFDAGSEVNGPWTLRVADDAAGDVGALQCWSLTLSTYACSPSGGPCESCPERTLLGSISEQSQLQTGRLVANNNASDCGETKSCPGAESLGTQRRFDAYTFQNGESNACITVALGVNPIDGPELFSAAYVGAFNPLNVCENYLADVGSGVRSGNTNSYSFNVAAHGRFVVVVSQRDASSDQGRYRLDVTGGSCRPMLHIRSLPPNQALLSWTTAAVGYELEGANTLAAPLPWLQFSNSPITLDSRLNVTIPASSNQNFYRLRQR